MLDRPYHDRHSKGDIPGFAFLAIFEALGLIKTPFGNNF